MPDRPLRIELDTLDATRGWDPLGDMWGGIADELQLDTMERLEELAPLLSDRVRKTFDAKGERGGKQQWEIRDNPTPLILTGALYRSFNGVVERTPTGVSLDIGTDRDYAAKHDQGLDGMVQREFMFFADEDVDLIEEILGRD